MKKTIVTLVLTLVFNLLFAQNQKVNDEMVIAQMNYCITALTNITNNKSMAVLEHESDMLVNNLTMREIVGLEEIKDFRLELMDAISKFEITEEERSIIKRIQAINSDSKKWTALANALNPTMLLTHGSNKEMKIQAAFQVLLAAARSAVEYNVADAAQTVEELQAMWSLRKEDLLTINNLRKSAFGIVYDLFEKYKLGEDVRLTEATANLFAKCIAETNAAKRVRLLEDNAPIFGNMTAYYYHLGMAYVDLKQYKRAEQLFNVYLEKYKKTPILRYDEKSGSIALALLTIKKNLMVEQKSELVRTVLNNLPSNSAAILQCAMVCIYELNQVERGVELIRKGIDDPNASDRGLLYMAAANMIPLVKKYARPYKVIGDSFFSATGVPLSAYLTYVYYAFRPKEWQSFGSTFNFSNVSQSDWFFFKTISNEVQLNIPERINFNVNDVLVYQEEHRENEVLFCRLDPKVVGYITDKEIDNVDCFAANKNLKYLFMEKVSDGVYVLKKSLDLNKVAKETWPRMNEFVLSSSDVEQIIKFCKKYRASDDKTRVVLKHYSGNNSMQENLQGYSVKYSGNKSDYYTPSHTKAQSGYYLRFVFSNGLQLLYKFDSDRSILKPYISILGDEINFANQTAKLEYSYKDVIKRAKEPENKSGWTNFFGLF